MDADALRARAAQLKGGQPTRPKPPTKTLPANKKMEGIRKAAAARLAPKPPESKFKPIK